MPEAYIAVEQVSHAYRTQHALAAVGKAPAAAPAGAQRGTETAGSAIPPQPLVIALDGVSLEVYRGEFVAVLGANGSGKSTLARHLNALLLPDSGRVRVDGLDTSEAQNVWPVRERVSMVFQNPDNQIVAAVVEEDVAFGPENVGLPPAEIRRRVQEALETVGLFALRRRAPSALSGGQKQRLAIAGALALNPACLVLDEPTAMLDPAGRREVLSTVRSLNREAGVTVVYITHAMDEAALADRVVVLSRGKVALTGSPRAVLTRPEQLRPLGLEPPPGAVAADRLRRAGLRLPPDILTLEELVDALCRLKSSR